MTKNKAYEVLGISSDASTEEIKAAYAELSKKYHPEENPEEFQQIHEAYRILIRGNRGRRTMESAEFSQEMQVEETEFHGAQTQDLLFEHRAMENIVSSEDSDSKEMTVQYDFDVAVHKIQQEHYLHELQVAVDKLDDIIGIIMKKSINDIILKEQLEKLPMEIRLSPQFIEKLYSILENRFVADECHELLIEELHLYDEELLEQYQYLAQFKELIDRKNEEYWSPEVRNKRNGSMLVGLFIIALIVVFVIFK